MQTKTSNQANGSASVGIKEVFVTPVAFDKPSYFYLEIANTGLEKASNFLVSVDFGKAKNDGCSFKPSSIVKLDGVIDIGIFRFTVSELHEDERVYLSCNLSLPSFEQILISGGNLQFDRKLSFTDYSQPNKGSRSGWEILLAFLAVCIGLPFSIYLMMVVMQLINRWLKLKW
ncbi:MAG: hypothetical protein VW985_09290 [Gammaproteobacteria bacterium]